MQLRGIGKLLSRNLSQTSKLLQKSSLQKVIIKTKAERAFHSWKGAITVSHACRKSNDKENSFIFQHFQRNQLKEKTLTIINENMLINTIQ